MLKDKVDEPKKKVLVVEEIESPEESESQESISVDKAPEVVENTEGSNDSKKNDDIKYVSNTNTDEIDDYERPNYLWIIVPTALLVGALVGGLITYFSGISRLDTNTDAAATPTPVATTSPSVDSEPTTAPVSNLKKDELKIQILNGSGVSGAAGKAKTLLEGLGYKNIDAGNASSSDFATTEVAIKDTKKEYLDAILKDLSKNYEASEAAKPLAATSKYDLVITLGKK